LHPRPSGRWAWTLWLLGCVLGSPLAMGAGPAEREKTDVVVQDNGDRLTGRILYVQFGILQLSSKHSGSVAIEWPSVHTIISQYEFRIERFGGQLYAGPIATTPDGLTLIVSPGKPDEARLPMAEVSRILPYDTDFWHRVDGSASVGYSYTKASQVSQASAALDAHYGGVNVDSQLSAHVIVNNDPAGSSNQSQVISSTFFLREDRNFWGIFGEYEGNENLGIHSRLVAGPLLGRRLYQSGAADVTGLAGVVYDQEWATGNAGPQGSAEGLFMLQWRVYKFVYPKATLDFSVLGFPSITDAPRFRAGANISLTFKMTDRFALKLSEYGNYDSHPPGETTENLDYGVDVSLSYNFGYVIP
jgi:Protein of unknown function, DUF481